jgi:glycosyltransferase involved in cell wall biosynthesis
MLAYIDALRRLLPVVAPDLVIVEIGSGDNFDLAEQVGIPLALAQARPRLVHFPTPYVPRFVPAPHVVTVHDVIDLEFPQFAKAKVGPYWRRIVGPVLRSARAVITDDDTTVGLLERFLRVDPARVRVIPLGVDETMTPDVGSGDPVTRAANGGDAGAWDVERARPYAFYAGNHRPHKDLATLIRAWESLPSGVPLDLLLTGEPNAELTASRGDDGALVFLGDRSTDDVWSLHRGAMMYVHPALREGFGLPMLEALRVGTPVIAADAAVPRVLRDFVATYPTRDVDALRDQMLAVLMMPEADRAHAAERARLATAHLTWERTVRATADLYRELLA